MFQAKGIRKRESKLFSILRQGKTVSEAVSRSRLWTRGLRKSYGGRQVVSGVDISIESGSVIGLLGPNGAGKTTTFYMVVGLARPESGQVFMDDEEITHMPMHMRARRGISYLPQEASVFRKLSVADNLMAII